MGKRLVGIGLAGASVLSGCGNTGTGLGSDIEHCQPEVETAVIIEIDELKALQSQSVDWIKDPTASDGFWAEKELDVADKQGELSCLNDEGKLVLTVAGHALRAAVSVGE